MATDSGRSERDYPVLARWILSSDRTEAVRRRTALFHQGGARNHHWPVRGHNRGIHRHIERLIAARIGDRLRTLHEKEGWNPPTKELSQIYPNQSALTQFLPAERPDQADRDVRAWESMALLEFLGNMRFLEPSPERMRQPSVPGQTRLGDGGENLPTVLQHICSDPRRQETLAAWTRELTPMDVLGFHFETGPSGRVHLFLKESNGRKISADAASDGTLRFLAILAALLDDAPAGLYVFEEIDNGIHPSRLKLLLELIEGQTRRNGIQVLTTTHSPDLLSMVSDDTFDNTSVICRLPGLGQCHRAPGRRFGQCSQVAPIPRFGEAPRVGLVRGCSLLRQPG